MRRSFSLVGALILLTAIAGIGRGDVGEGSEGEASADPSALAVRKTPDKTASSWRDLKVVVVDRPSNGCTLRQVLLDFGFAADHLQVADLSSDRLGEADVVMVADGATGVVRRDQTLLSALEPFVRRGGVCWLFSQDPQTWNSQCLPERLRSAVPVRQYGLRCVGSKAPHYVCPWLVQRHHAVFNHPYPLDESDFSFWTPTVDGEPLFTAAAAALPQAPGWDVLGRYADPACARGALILQSPEGEGLYFWTQIFSPQIVWRQSDRQPRRAWEKLLENVLTYFVAFRRGEVWRVQSEPRPWSVLAGEEIAFETKYESPLEFDRAEAEVQAPDGSRSVVRLTPAGRDLLRGKFTPLQGGEHLVRIVLRFQRDTEAHDHFRFKVTKGWTKYHSIAHIHVRDCNGYGTQCPGGLLGAARRLGFDVLQLAPIHDEGRWDEIRATDNPACRLIPGAEFHYRLYDRTGHRGKNAYEDMRGVGYSSFIPYPLRIVEDQATSIVGQLIERVHGEGGLVFGNPGAFWAHQGLPLDGVEADMGLGFSWGKPPSHYPWAPNVSPVDLVEVDPRLGSLWSKHRPIWVQGAVDCHGLITLLTRRSWNCVWLDKPLTIANYLAAIKAGRFAAVSRIDQVWLDIAGQPMGGVVYAVDEAPIHLCIDAGHPPRGIGAVRWRSAVPKLSPLIGDLEFNDQRYYRVDEQAYVVPPESPRTLRRVEIIRNDQAVKTYAPDSRAMEADFSDRVLADSWYCLRAESSDGCAYSNPVFVKRIEGPPGAWLWSEGKILHVKLNQAKNAWSVGLAAGGNLHFRLPGKNVALTMDGKRLAGPFDPQTGIGEVTLSASAKEMEISWASDETGRR